MPTERWLFRNLHPDVERSYRRAIGLRRRHPWLVDAQIELTQVEDARVVVRARARQGGNTLHLSLNLTDDPMPLPAGSRREDRVLEAEPATDRSIVAPHGWAVTG